MKIGMNLPVMVPGLDRDALTSWCRRIDQGPFSSLAIGERITFPNPEVLVTMSAAAALTERVRLAFTVIVLPMHNTALMAKRIATLDVISGGRLTVGLGVGAREEDFRAVGATWDNKRLGRMERQVAEMRRLWSGEPPAEECAPIEPYPVQEGGPPLWAGALLHQSLQRAARWADGVCGFQFGPTPEEISFQFDAARAAWREAGRDGAPYLVTSCWFALGDAPTQQLEGYLERYLAFMGPGVAKEVVPTVRATSADALRDVIALVRDLGADELLLVPTTLDPTELDRVADLVG